MTTVMISVSCPDRPGLIAAITGRLFDLGVNLGDSSFAMLGTGAEFSSVCQVPDDLSAQEIGEGLADLNELKGARIEVRPFTLEPDHGPSGRPTHRVTVSGGDRPGLVARLSEVFGQFGANIVRMDAQRLPEQDLYVTRFTVAIGSRAEACLATIANTAGELHLDCRVEDVAGPA